VESARKMYEWIVYPFRKRKIEKGKNGKIPIREDIMGNAM